jgi:segregation and condensation protein B
VEAALFMAGKPVEKGELADLLNADLRDVEEALEGLKAKYTGPIIVRTTGDTAFMMAEDEYVNALWFLGKGEFSTAELKTLAMVAYYAPVLQSDIVHSRGNRAYEHLRKLEEAGLLNSEKSGNTLLMSLSRKFYEYFGDDIVDRIRNSPPAEVNEA